MKKTTKNSRACRLAAGLMSAVIILSGCGSGSDGNENTTDSITPAVTAEADPAATEPAVSPEAAPEATEPAKEPAKEPAGGTEMRDMTTQELIEDMGLGINLGNTFEATGSWIKNGSVSDYETCWGSPVITEEMIKGYKNAGFGVVRVPANWSNLMSEDYTIDPEFDKRIHEVVDWILDNDMYVILNMHHETWLADMPANEEETLTHYKRLWEQIAESFKDYGDRLMFESLNEEGGWDSVWNQYGGSTEGKDVAFGYLNTLNQSFVDIVRASGGNNEKRHLLIAGYYTNIQHTCDDLFVMPSDPQNRMAVSVHYYDPSTLTILEADADWGKAKTEWGSDADLKGLDKNLDLMKTHFTDNGIPVIVGEYGCFGKNKEQEVKRAYMIDVCRETYIRGMLPVLWDTQDTFYNRKTLTYNDEEMLREMMEIPSLGRSKK